VKHLSPIIKVKTDSYFYCRYMKTIKVKGMALLTGEKEGPAPVFVSELFGANLVNDRTQNL